MTTQKNGASALGLQRVLGLKKYETAWTWLHTANQVHRFNSLQRVPQTALVSEISHDRRNAFWRFAGVFCTFVHRPDRCSGGDGRFQDGAARPRSLVMSQLHN